MMQPIQISGYEQIAKNYERGRPDYPKEAALILAKALQLGQGKQVLDLAAGTGKLTKALMFTGADWSAVEPVFSMRSIFQMHMPDVPVFEGCAEKIPFLSESFDAVVVGTAFHWFDAERALEEIARVLKPEGNLGLIWNIFDEEVDWVRQIRTLWKTADPLNFSWKSAFEKTPLFTSLHQETFHYTFPGTVQDVLDRLFSAKIFGELPKEEQEELIQRTLQILNSHPETREKTVLQIPYRVEMAWCSKKRFPST